MLGVALAVVNQIDLRLVHIQPDHIDIGTRELDRQRQPNVTETDYSYFHCPVSGREELFTGLSSGDGSG